MDLTMVSVDFFHILSFSYLFIIVFLHRLYDWQTMLRKDVRDVIKGQASNTQLEFEQRANEVILQFAEQVCLLKRVLSVLCFRGKTFPCSQFPSSTWSTDSLRHSLWKLLALPFTSHWRTWSSAYPLRCIPTSSSLCQTSLTFSPLLTYIPPPSWLFM